MATPLTSTLALTSFWSQLAAPSSQLHKQMRVKYQSCHFYTITPYGCPVHRNLEVTGSNHDQILPCCGYSPSCGKEASALKPRGNVASCIHYTHSSFVPRRKSQPPPIPPQSLCLMLCPIVFHQSWGARERPRSESTQKHSSISTCPPYALLLLRNQLENHFRPILLGKENFLLNAVFHLIKCHVYYLH